MYKGEGVARNFHGEFSMGAARDRGQSRTNARNPFSTSFSPPFTSLKVVATPPRPVSLLYLPLRLHPSFPHRRAHASPSPPFPAFPSGSCGEASSPTTTGLSRWLFTSKRVSAKPWKRYEPEFLGDACVLVVFK